MKQMVVRFLLRWFVSSLGLWVAATLFHGHISLDGSAAVVLGAGLILAIINTVLKPVLIILSLPAILLTLGIFMLVINGLTVYIASTLYSPLHVSSFWMAIVAGIVIGLVNYLVTALL